jgi:hypothetical protein
MGTGHYLHRGLQTKYEIFLEHVSFAPLIGGQPHEGEPGPVGQREGQPLHNAEDEPGDQLAVLVEGGRPLVPHGCLHDGVVVHVGDLDQRRRGECGDELFATGVKVVAVQRPFFGAEALLHSVEECVLAGAELGGEGRVPRVHQDHLIQDQRLHVYTDN